MKIPNSISKFAKAVKKALASETRTTLLSRTTLPSRTTWSRPQSANKHAVSTEQPVQPKFSQPSGARLSPPQPRDFYSNEPEPMHSRGMRFFEPMSKERIHAAKPDCRDTYIDATGSMSRRWGGANVVEGFSGDFWESIGDFYQADPIQSLVSTGLGSDVDELLAYSPSLQTDLKQLKAEGWVIKYGVGGGGSYTSRSTKTMVVDGFKEGNPAFIMKTLAHEVGHATYTANPDYSSKEAYLNNKLADEGAATLNAIKIQREILANGGLKISDPSGKAEHVAAYNEIYDNYLKDGDAQAARQKIGEIFAHGELASGSGGKTYNNYYGEWYVQHCSNPLQRLAFQMSGQ